jgi:PKD repeat protein
VTLTVTNSAGRTDQTTQNVRVTEPEPSGPTAKLKVGRASDLESDPLLVTADGSGSLPGQGDITSYEFNFGDGKTTGPQQEGTARHTYESRDTYTVTLTVTNSAGGTDQTTQVITVD